MVLITGASGGIGYAVTEYFANRGVSVLACDVVERPFLSPNVRFLKMDVTDETSVLSVFTTLQKEGVTLDAVLSIAGVFAIDSFLEMPEDALKKLFEVNLFGAIRVNRILHPLLKKDGRFIVTTSEVAPLDPMPFNGVYHTTKTALDCYAQSLRQECNLLGQKVVTVRPGAFRTPLQNGALEKTQELSQKTVLFKQSSPKFYGLVKRFMGNPLPPEKIAPLFLKAVTAKRPKTVYAKHRNPLLVLTNILPKKWQCFFVKRLLR